MVKLEISNIVGGIRPCNGYIKVKYTSCYLFLYKTLIINSFRNQAF